MFLTEPLQKIGLTEKEAKVYLATLELGGDKVQEIAKKAGLKRPTVYVILDELKQKGLIFHEKKTGADIYTAVNPDQLKRKIEEQKKSLDEALPFLRAMYTGEKSKPQVQVFEGIEGMKEVYFNHLFKSKTEILFFTAVEKLHAVFPDVLDMWIKNTQTKERKKTREILNADPGDIEYGLKVTKGNPDTEVRIIPYGSAPPLSGVDNAIFEDKVILVSLEGKLFTTLIQSKVLADALRTLFELAWASAVPIEEFVKKKS